jgi:putative ABC transport system ATP-binding protein
MNDREAENIYEPNSGKSVLRASNLSKQVSSPEGPLTILDDINLEIFGGEAVALIGESGAGKTTLLALLAGLDKPSTGKVWLCGEDLTALNEDGRALLPLELAEDPTARERAAEALESVGLQDRRRHYPKQLSGGEKQRVAIARAFVSRPAVLFADEPTGNLDTASGDRVADLVFDLNKQLKTTLVLVTHDRVLAGRCDRVLELAAGRLIT